MVLLNMFLKGVLSAISWHW